MFKQIALAAVALTVLGGEVVAMKTTQVERLQLTEVSWLEPYQVACARHTTVQVSVWDSILKSPTTRTIVIDGSKFRFRGEVVDKSCNKDGIILNLNKKNI